MFLGERTGTRHERLTDLDPQEAAPRRIAGSRSTGTSRATQRVVMAPAATRALRRVPRHIRETLEFWVESVEEVSKHAY